MEDHEIIDRVLDLADYYVEQLEIAKTPMDIMGLNWYVQEVIVNLIKDIYVERRAH